jgi:hypothetical protein
MNANRKMNGKALSVHADADESFDLPNGFAAEMNRRCNAFLEKRNMIPKTNYFGNFRSTFQKEGGAK